MTNALASPRHEAFAQAVAKGMTADAAYVAAGYRPNRGNAVRLKTNKSIRRRVGELVDAGARHAEVELGDIITALKHIAFTGLSRFMSISPEAVPFVDLSRCTAVDLDVLSELVIDTTQGLPERGPRRAYRIRLNAAARLRALEILLRHFEKMRATTEPDDRLTSAICEINQRGAAMPIGKQ